MQEKMENIEVAGGGALAVSPERNSMKKKALFKGWRSTEVQRV